ncbi:hypothetical protein OQA88_3097 [Cercophora sp. LCS_1]
MGQHQSRPGSPKAASQPKVDPKVITTPPANRPPTPAPTIAYDPLSMHPVSHRLTHPPISSSDIVEVPIDTPTDDPIPTPKDTLKDDLDRMRTEVESMRKDMENLRLQLSEQERIAAEDKAKREATLEQERMEREEAEAQRQKQRKEEEAKEREEKDATRKIVEVLEREVQGLKGKLGETEERQKRTSTDMEKMSEKVELRLRQKSGFCAVM